MASSTAFARKASRDHFKRAASPHQSAPKTDLGASRAIPTMSCLIAKSEAFATVARQPRQNASIRSTQSAPSARIPRTPIELCGQPLCRGGGPIVAAWKIGEQQLRLASFCREMHYSL
jgi:hypothetical protein